MPAAMDQMLARLQTELEERRSFQDGLVAAANEQNRDLNPQEMELFTRAQQRETELVAQMAPLAEQTRLGLESSARLQQLADLTSMARTPAAVQGGVEYRSAGAYIAELWYAAQGDIDARNRLEIYRRVAAHQTTADNPGLLPENVVQPVVDFVDVSRPICSTLGPQDLGAGAWSYARVTQHTQVGLQAGEKTELASRKMTITKTPLGADTYGGYVNVSKQDINRTSPAILDMVINDLAGQYAIQTEAVAATVLTAAASVGPIIAASPTSDTVAAAVWGAAGQVYAATKGQGTVVVAVSPDQLGVIGPLFPNVNPANAFSTGFQASNIGTGAQGSISGLTVVMSAGLAADTILVYSTAAAKAFEYKYGNMTVDEPSVWGVQVGYAGDFDCVVIEATGVVRVTTAP